MDARPRQFALMPALATVLTLGGCGAAPSPTPATVTPVEFTEFYADANITGEVTVVVGKVTGDGGHRRAD